MRLAVATQEGEVAEHFGRCGQYTLADIDGDEVVQCRVIESPGHRPGYLPRFLAEREVDCVMAGGMGPRAQSMFAERGIQVVVGATGSVDRVVSDWISGELQTGTDLCDHADDESSGC